MHLNEGDLQALLDSELSEADEREARRHVAVCDTCSSLFAEIGAGSALLGSSLSLLDRPVRQLRLVGAPVRPVARPARWSAVPLGKAAALLLSVAAAASATIPGSPVRGWIEDRLAPSAAPVALEAPAEEATATAVAPPMEAGVGAEPLDGHLRIVLTDAAPDLEVRAAFTDARRGGVYGSELNEGVRFESSPGRVEAIGATSGTLRIEIPRAAQTAVVEVDGMVYLAKEGDALRLQVPQQDASGAEVTFTIRP